MIDGADRARDASDAAPRLWGLSPLQFHDRYWLSRSVQVVRNAPATEPLPDVELFLLADASTMLLFDLAAAVDRLYWINPMLLTLRVHQTRRPTLCPRDVESTGDTRATVFERRPWAGARRVMRIGLTAHREVAAAWARSADVGYPWRDLRRRHTQRQRGVLSLGGIVADARSVDRAIAIVGTLATIWRRPETSFDRLQKVVPNLWNREKTSPAAVAHHSYPIWVGDHRTEIPREPVGGPTILWDRPDPVRETDTLNAAARSPRLHAVMH